MVDKDGHDNMAPLHIAIVSNELQRVKHEIRCLKKQNKSLDSQNTSSIKNILFACRKRVDATIIKLLIEEEADVNLCDDKQATALHVACSQGNEEIAKILLEAGANINAQNVLKIDNIEHLDNTPLHYAVDRRYSKVINLLLDACAKTDIENAAKKIPLCYVNRIGIRIEDSTLERLVKATGTTNLNKPYFVDRTILEQAIFDNYIKLASILIKHGVDHNNIPVRSIRFAILKKRLEIFNLMWKVIDIKKINEDIQFWYDLFLWCSDTVYPEVIERVYNVIKTPGVVFNPDGRYFSCLVKNVKNSFAEVDVYRITKSLLEKGALIHEEDLEAFVYLCSDYHLSYHRKKCAGRGINLLNLFIENDVNITSYIVYFSMVNHPKITLNLLQYCIMCDPIDIFNHLYKCKRIPDVLLLNLIKDVLKLCSPYYGLRYKRFLCIKARRNKKQVFRTPNTLSLIKIHFPWERCVYNNEIDNELCDEVLNLLQKNIVPLPTLVELARNKIRQQLRLSCKDTKSFLQSLKSLELPRIYTDIIQCKANIINLN